MSLGENLSSECYYKNLGLSKGASEQDIKAAYRKMALKYHPDKNKNNPEQAETNFKKVAEAYSVLSDKEKREVYDTYGKRGLEGSCGGSGQGAHFVNPEDIFRHIFGGGSGFGDDFGGHGGFSFGGDPFGGPRRRARHTPPPPPKYPAGPDIIPKGTRVWVHSLASSTQYNGMEGSLVGYDKEKRRYRVKIGDDADDSMNDDNTISVKSSNIIQLVSGIKLRDIQSRPQLNDWEGSVIGFANDRYHVRLKGLEGSACVSVGLTNLILPPNTRVHIHSLTGAAQYNGQTGRVVSFKPEDNRYLVELGGETGISRQLKLKSENLLI